MALLSGMWLLSGSVWGQPAFSQREGPALVMELDLRSCIEEALLSNRALQIERINPAIARLTLEASYGAYDPIFLADLRQESDADSGGLDPLDLSRDAIYSAEADIARAGVTGLLPTGLTYTLTGNYAHSFGTRNGFNFDSYNLFLGIEVRQPLLRNFWIDQTRLTIGINKRNLRITELGVVFLTMDVIRQVEQAYAELLFAHELVRIRADLEGTRKQFLESIQRRIEGGTLTVLDEKLAQSQLATVQAQLATAEDAVVLAENELKTLLGYWRPEKADVRIRPRGRLVAAPELFDRPASWQYGLQSRPDLAQLRQDVEKANLDLRFRRNQLFPSLDLVAGYGRRGASTIQTQPPVGASSSLSAAWDQIDDAAVPNDMIGILFTVPLTLKAERANYRASQELRKQAELRVKQYEELVVRQIADAIHLAESSLARVDSTRRAREFGEEALAAEEKKLAGGKSTLYVVLELQSDLAAARVEEARAKADYLKAVAQLHFAEGSSLDRHRIEIEFE